MGIRSLTLTGLVAGAVGVVGGYLSAPDVRALNLRVDERMDGIDSRLDRIGRLGDLQGDIAVISRNLFELRVDDGDGQGAELDKALIALEGRLQLAEVGLKDLAPTIDRSDQMLSARLDQITRRLARISQQVADSGAAHLRIAASPEMTEEAAALKPQLPSEE